MKDRHHPQEAWCPPNHLFNVYPLIFLCVQDIRLEMGAVQ